MSNHFVNATRLSHCGWPDLDEYATIHPIHMHSDMVLRPIWLVMCTLGNTLNILFIRKMRTYQSALLVAQAYSNLACMWLWTGTYAPIIAVVTPVWKGWLLQVTLVLGNAAAQFSDWILVLFGSIRLVSTLYPLESRVFLTLHRIRIAIACMVPLSIATWTFLIVEHATKGDARKYLWIEQWRTFDDYGIVVSEYFTFIGILVTNVIIISLLCTRRRQRNLSEKWSKEVQQVFHLTINLISPRHHTDQPSVSLLRTHGKNTQTASTLRFLTASTCMYLVTKTPTIIYQAIEYLCAAQLSEKQYVVFIAIYNQMLFANYSISFLVYCGTNRMYLKKGLIQLRRRKSPPSRLASQRSQPTVSTTI